MTKVGMGRGGGQRVDGDLPRHNIYYLLDLVKWILAYTELGYNNHSDYSEPC